MNGGESGDLKSQTSYRAGFQADGAVDANAVFRTTATGIAVETLRIGELYIEMTGYARPVLAKGDLLSNDDVRQAAVIYSPYCGPLDEWTAEALNFYAGRWTRRNQQEFLLLLCPEATRTLPGQPARATNPIAAFDEWLTARHGDEELADERLDELFDEFLANWITRPVDVTSLADSPTSVAHAPVMRDEDIDQRAADIAALDALYDLEVEQPAEPAPAPAVQRIDPTLPEDTRLVLEVLADSDLMYATDDLTPTAEVAALVDKALDWGTNGTSGRRVAGALRAVNVFKVEPRPRIDGKKTECFRTADLAQAVQVNLVGGDQDG
jgi:hypothetical protein